MTCKQLGGACDLKFHASTFNEIAEMSKNHGTEMFNKGDIDHINAIEKMKELMQNPKEMNEWFVSKKQEFDSLPEDL
jgi:hypothetical protein